MWRWNLKFKYCSIYVIAALCWGTVFAADTSRDFALLKKKFDEAARVDSLDQLPDIAGFVTGLYEGIGVSEDGSTRFPVIAGVIIEGGSSLGGDILGEVLSVHRASDIRLLSDAKLDFKLSPVAVEGLNEGSLRSIARQTADKFRSEAGRVEAQTVKNAETHATFVKTVFPQLKKEYFTATGLVVEGYYDIFELIPPIFTADRESDWTTEYRRDPATEVIYFKESGKIGERGVPYFLSTSYKWTFYGYLKKK